MKLCTNASNLLACMNLNLAVFGLSSELGHIFCISGLCTSGFYSLSDLPWILENYSNSEIAVAGDFNVHNSSWLRYSGLPTPEGQYVELFAAHNQLAQLVKEPTHISCVDGHQNNTLDLFLTSHPDMYEVEVLAPLGNSDYCTIFAYFPFSGLRGVSSTATERSVFVYGKACWEGLNNFFRHFNWKLCSMDSNVDTAARMVVNIIRTGIKSRNKSWFNQACTGPEAVLFDACVFIG